ncbi:hypothetical protein YW7DRAFT_04508 [Streptomyces sp. AmelKG-E11A]|nr:hypothetical protein YW7DRAFT_04508 [Streptomyces sp. AmelKG-E11A]
MKLTTARHPARVLVTRIQHTGRDPLPNRRAEAARLRSLTAAAYARQSPPAHPVVAPATAADQRGRRRS